MHLGFHGGKCCGIKHVYGFDDVGPDSEDDDNCAEELEHLVCSDNEKWPDAYGYDVSSTDRAFHYAAPSETKGERLKRYIEYLKEHRPGGVLEAVLVNSWEYPQYPAWKDFLHDLGFKEVNRFKNSNSDNTCVILHLNMVQE